MNEVNLCLREKDSLLTLDSRLIQAKKDRSCCRTMPTVLKESRDDRDELSAGDTQSELLGGLTRSVSRLRALSTAEYGDGSAIHLEHTLDAILNMAQKTTFDDSASWDSLRVAKPVQKRKQEKARRNNRFCGIRHLLCTKDERNEEDYTAFPSNFTRMQYKHDKKCRERIWKEGRSSETADSRLNGRVLQVEQQECDTLNNRSDHSKKDLMIPIGHKYEDDISSLSSDLFARRKYSYDSNAAGATGLAHRNSCLIPYDDWVMCKVPNRQVDEAQFSFLDLLSCQRSHLQGRSNCAVPDEEDEMKILGLRSIEDDTIDVRPDHYTSTKGTRRKSSKQSASRSKISRVEPEHTPKQMHTIPSSDPAMVHIYSHGRRIKR